MQRHLLLLAGLFTTSCDRSDYVINVKGAHIERVDRLSGSGYVVVDQVSADTMAKYGDVYVDGRSCPNDTCKTFTVGSLRKHTATPVEGGVRLNLSFHTTVENDEDHPPFWLRDVACIKVEAVQGLMGRTGRSDWNCSVQHARR